MSLTALDEVLRNAASVRVSEIQWYGEITVDLSRPEERDRLRAAMKVGSLPGYVCACRGQARLEFFDAQSEPLTEVVLHHGISLDWQWESGHAELADGVVLLRWLEEHGLPGLLLSDAERPERLAWIAAMPPALEEMAGDLVGHFATADDSKHVVEARKRMRAVDSVTGVLQLLSWYASGIGGSVKSPPYEDVPGLILRETPIAEIIAALEDPRADARHDAAAARLLLVGNSRIKQRLDVARLPGPLRVRIREAGYAVPQWAERLLLNA
ncbi:hypothetical protein [Lentzea sp. NPDC051838]|uniref:hypothetical protein n=1 Tax=Lentzea sp. NPDC051838 TaxID=3154849 RepID=UPI003418BDA4